MTPTEAKQIRRRSGITGPHPLGGMSVREFVETARKGWPKVPHPSPKMQAERAAKIAKDYGGPDNAFLESVSY